MAGLSAGVVFAAAFQPLARLAREDATAAFLVVAAGTGLFGLVGLGRRGWRGRLALAAGRGRGVAPIRAFEQAVSICRAAAGSSSRSRAAPVPTSTGNCTRAPTRAPLTPGVERWSLGRLHLIRRARRSDGTGGCGGGCCCCCCAHGYHCYCGTTTPGRSTGYMSRREGWSLEGLEEGRRGRRRRRKTQVTCRQPVYATGRGSTTPRPPCRTGWTRW